MLLSQMISSVINILLILIFVICWILIIIKLIKNSYSPVKTVEVKVVDKHKQNAVSKFPKYLMGEHYSVVFLTDDDRKIKFSTSEITFNSYKIGKRGMLKYKGNKIIDFK